MASEKYHQLVDLLNGKTASNQLEWKETAYSDDFQSSFPNYSIILRESKLQSGTWSYKIDILNSEGKIVDSFSNSELDTEHSDRMAELYERVRRQALGADEALDEILNALRNAR